MSRKARKVQMLNGVYQRTNDDCGAGAVATLLGIPYESVADTWFSALGKSPRSSSYPDLIKVIQALGFRATKKTKTTNGIRRVRAGKGDRHSHWVVVNGEDLWCPTTGYYSVKEYPWQAFGHGIELE